MQEKPQAPQVNELFLRGFSLFKSGRYEQAADYFRMVTLLAPLEGRFWISLGHALRKTGDIDSAIETFKAALLLGQRGDKDLWLTLAECFHAKGEQAQAMVALEEAMMLAPEEEQVRLELFKKTLASEVCYAK